MNSRLLFVAGGLILVWAISVLTIGVATVAGGVGLSSGPIVPLIVGSVVASVLLVGYYTFARFRDRRHAHAIQ